MCLFFKQIDHDRLRAQEWRFYSKGQKYFHPITACPFAENKGFQAYQKLGFAKDTPILWWLLYP